MSLWQIAPKIPPSLHYHGLDKITSQLLYNRGVMPDDAKSFLLADTYYDSMLFTDMGKVVERIRLAVYSSEKILVYGDYDVDGICAVSILWDYLYTKMHANVIPFIPSRFNDGYGLSQKQVDKFISDGTSLIITVDCGITAVSVAEHIKKLGIDLIVTDHHHPKDELPDCFAIIHPQRGYPFQEITGSAVAYKLIQAISGNLDTTEYMDLVALSTICDIVDLKSENRSFVKSGLKVINSKKRVGIAKLMEISNIDFVDVYHIGYILGPKINASGRIYDAFDGLRLLSTKKEEYAHLLAVKLDNLNKERKKLLEDTLSSIIPKIDSSLDFNLVVSDDWHEGIIGLVAGRITEVSNRPSIVLTKKTKDLYIGSARSVNGFNIVNYLEKNSSLLEGFGGHTAAAGLQIKQKNIPILKKSLETDASQFFKNVTKEKTINIDDVVSMSNVNESLYDEINTLSPFGKGNPIPVFLMQGVKILSAYNVGKSNEFLKMKLTDKDGDSIFDAIWFTPNLTTDILSTLAYIDIVFSLNKNVWGNVSKIEFRIIDLKPSVF